MFEMQRLEILGSGRRFHLWVDQFQLVPGLLYKRCVRLGADTQPVDPDGRGNRTVALHTDFETGCMQRVDRGLIELQQRLTASANDIGPTASTLTRPYCGYRTRKIAGRFKLAAAGPICTHKLGIAELAGRFGTVFLTSRPEIATCESQKDRGTPSMCALALQRVIHFLDRICHTSATSGSETPASSNPFARNRHAGH